jgi:hypothetical protein
MLEEILKFTLGTGVEVTALVFIGKIGVEKYESKLLASLNKTTCSR